MRSDSDIKQDVEAELRWDADINATDIAVTVKNGVVMLTGFVRSYRQKRQAERDAKRVAGVVGVANDIEVRWPVIHQRPDPQIARNAVEALQSQLPLSADFIKVTVDKGWITLEGDAEWHFQKEKAEEAVRHVRGATGVTNAIVVKPKVAPSEVKRKIEEALKRSEEVDATNITAGSRGGEVML